MRSGPLRAAAASGAGARRRAVFRPRPASAGPSPRFGEPHLPRGRRPDAAQGRLRPLNVIVILADDLGAKDLGCYGHPGHRTPNLDALARGGVRFETCYATPICPPSRVELLSGRCGFRTGWSNFIGRATTRKERLEADLFTAADLAHSRGYRTAMAGK